MPNPVFTYVLNIWHTELNDETVLIQTIWIITSHWMFCVVFRTLVGIESGSSPSEEMQLMYSIAVTDERGTRWIFINIFSPPFARESFFHLIWNIIIIIIIIINIIIIIILDFNVRFCRAKNLNWFFFLRASRLVTFDTPICATRDVFI